MLIKESQLLPKSNILSQLNEAVYLTQEESEIHLDEVPVLVKENGSNLVDYCYLERISELNGCSIFEAANLIKERNDISDIKISIDEGDAIAMQESFDPECMVVKPISEDNNEVFWANYVCEQYMNDQIDDDILVEALMSVNEASVEDLLKKHQQKHQAQFMEKENRQGKEAEDRENEIWDKQDSGEMSAKDARDARRKNDRERMEQQVQNLNVRYAQNKKSELAAERLKRIRANHNKQNAGDTAPSAQEDKSKEVSTRTKSLIANNKVKREYGYGTDKKGTGLLTHNQISSNPLEKHDEGKKRLGNLLDKHNKKQEETQTNTQNQKPETTNNPPSSDTEKKSLLQKHPKAIGLAAGMAGSALATAAYNHYANKPKSVIGKKIAALRNVYSKFMKRAQSSNDAGVAAKLKKVAAKILSVIDKLMGYLQNKAG